jgi:hypothetical protein
MVTPILIMTPFRVPLFFSVLYYYSTQLIEEINDCTMIQTRDLLEISKLECVNLILNHSAIRAFES